MIARGRTLGALTVVCGDTSRRYSEADVPLIEVYKKNIEKAEPVGGYVNNNIMVPVAPVDAGGVTQQRVSDRSFLEQVGVAGLRHRQRRRAGRSIE